MQTSLIAGFHISVFVVQPLCLIKAAAVSRHVQMHKILAPLIKFREKKKKKQI